MAYQVQIMQTGTGPVQGIRCIISGQAGLGKTTFANSWESPVIIPIEDGLSAIQAQAFQKVQSLDDLYSCIGYLLQNDHPYRTLVVDSMDALETICVWPRVCSEQGIQNIEQIGYGKGYVLADNHWRTFLQGLDALRSQKNMNIVLIVHSDIRTFTPPDSDPYDRYQLKLHKRASAFLVEWCDLMVFVTLDKRLIGQSKEGEKKRAESSGDRVIFTQERPAFLAKSRWPLPEKIFVGQDRTWSAFHKAMNIATNNGYAIPQAVTSANI